jgi:acyl carrier protein
MTEPSESQLADRIALMAKIVAHIMRDPSIAARVTGDTDLLDDVGMDSLDVTELVLRIEDELDYEIALEEVGAVTFRNVRELAKTTFRQSAAARRTSA